MNLTNNRVKISLTPEELLEVKNMLQSIDSIMPFLIGLTSDERTKLPKMNVKNKVFTEDSIQAISQNRGLVPMYISEIDMETDLLLYKQLDELLGIVSQLTEKLEDTKILAGSEAYASALMAYKNFRVAANSGMPGADAVCFKLKQRFKGNSSPAEKATNKKK